MVLDTSLPDSYSIESLKSESLVKTFMWAQWDMVNQVLYHIHHRKIPVSLVSEDEDDKESKPVRSNPTLSGLQFHDDLPHETVVSNLLDCCKDFNSVTNKHHLLFFL